MDLSDRLRRLGYTPSASSPAPARSVSRTEEAVDSVLAGEWRVNEHGRCFVAVSRYPLTHVHGGVQLESVLALRGRALSMLGKGVPSEIDFGRMAFLDTETTGLAGGTGTYVFLVGLGYFAATEFVVEQYFMRDYGEEAAMLHALNERLAAFETVVSFNGMSFDWPLLETRYAMVRQRLALEQPVHCDLLFPARRVWRERIVSCSLSSLEQHVLKVYRANDVPGWLVPSIYFEYVRERDARSLRPVFAHNEQDVLSMVSLLARLGRSFADPLGEATHAIDLFALGRIFEGEGAWEDCILYYEGALRGEMPPRLREATLCRLGFVYKRLRQSGQAEQVWRSLVSRPDALGVLPHIELAKHLEHKERKYSEAALVVERALNLLARAPADPWQQSRSERDGRDLRRRLARLQAKMKGKSSSPERGAGPAMTIVE
jgi:uncharacterized protein